MPLLTIVVISAIIRVGKEERAKCSAASVLAWRAVAEPGMSPRGAL